MSLLADLNTVLSPLLPIETGIFSGTAPDEYCVITPMTDTFAVIADNTPQIDVQEARLSVFCKGNYRAKVRSVVDALLAAGITVSARRYIGYENDTGYYHYSVDAENYYNWEVQENG